MILLVTFLLCVTLLYWIVGFKNIKDRYFLFFKKSYWTDYNIVEFSAWMAKALIIVPGLVFGKEIWWLHFFTLLTSSLLIWASMKKSLPTLIAFNTLWIGISLTIIFRNLI
jgi:hypothetical protein